MKRLGSLMLAIPLLMSLFILASGQTAFAATQDKNAASQKTIAWVNGQGKVVRVWTGSPSAALIVEKDEMAQLARLHAEHPFVMPATSASPSAVSPRVGVSPNIDRVSDSACGADSGTIYWKLWNNQSGSAGGVCFANAGDISINVFAVFEITTGNNKGNFSFTQNSSPGVRFDSPGNGLQWCKQVIIFPLTDDGFFDDVIKVGITTPTAACQG